jgi:hypothetical protein
VARLERFCSDFPDCFQGFSQFEYSINSLANISTFLDKNLQIANFSDTELFYLVFGSLAQDVSLTLQDDLLQRLRGDAHFLARLERLGRTPSSSWAPYGIDRLIAIDYCQKVAPESLDLAASDHTGVFQMLSAEDPKLEKWARCIIQSATKGLDDLSNSCGGEL